MSANCRKAVSYLAENTGLIAALTQQEILTGDPDYALSRIKEAKYDTSKGHAPRYIRVRTTPPRRVKYQPMLPAGNTTFSVPNPQTGTSMTVTGDRQGRGCSLPAETIQYGYDVKNRCLMGKAIEAGPWCIMDLLEKEALGPLLQKIWKDLPRYMKEDFGRQLLRDVIQFSSHLFTIGEGFPMSTGVGYFPAVPTGGPSIGFIRRIENILRPEGWNKGSMTPMMNGRASLQVRMSREAIEWAIAQRKKEKGLVLESTVLEDDGTFGKTVMYEGIQFIEADVPTRGYLVETASDVFEFVELDPYIITAADGEGFWPIPNPDFWNSSYVTDGGTRYRVCEIGHIIHPSAMERQSLGAIPSVPGKKFTRNFDFEVSTIPDWELADRGCNKDQFYFGYRGLHAYAVRPVNPELMTAFIYLAPTNRYEVVDPWQLGDTANLQNVNLAALSEPKVNPCEPCTAGDEVAARDYTDPTCTDLFPANGVGVMRMRAAALDVREDALLLTVSAERVGGTSGAASARITFNEGTATEPENWTTYGTGWTGTTGSSTAFYKTLSWADGEGGVKTALINIVEAAGDDDGKVLTAVLSNASGATLGSVTTTTITLIDPDNA